MVVDLIPVDVAEDILSKDMINKSNLYNMDFLTAVWQEYIEPGLDVHCGLCKERILNNWKAIQPQLLVKVKQSKLLDN